MQLADYMTRKKLTDDDVADAIGCSRVSVSRYRRGLKRPSWETTSRIHDFTGGKVTANDWLALEIVE